MTPRLTFTTLFVFLYFAALAQQRTYIESDGLVVIEFESAAPVSQWLDTTRIAGFTGTGYMEYTGTDWFNNPGFGGPTSFGLQISTPGTYRFQWRTRIAKGTSNTEHNDSWLRFNDADDFYAERSGSTVYPRGSGKTPNPEGSSSANWFKVYQNNLGSWSWNANTSDNDPHQIFVRFDTAGLYTFEVSGRSNGHAIDRIILYHSSVPGETARRLDRPESASTTSGLRSTPKQQVGALYPNPAQDRLLVSDKLLQQAETAAYTATDVLGRTTVLHAVTAAAETVQLDLSALAPGEYGLQIVAGEEVRVGRFVKR